ncbi:AraC family transcriptional regulator [Halomonas aestuarii]|uniref:AraC family transcriptional regulator n=1 Tax=Halomonas aestuarii TaxID=1897729 RepID=A0A1J0VEC6_9GAMM|nr:AraC family transcriptional regulator [Halomonas aestuarii]APE30380.1 AraC family transcriptional regulator [Halomonas aestuarii]
MDTLGGLLDAPRARGAFTLRTVMTPPWSLRIVAESPLTLIAGVTGETWLVPDEGEPVRIGPGDIAVTRAPDHYTVAHSPAMSPQVVIHPGQRCCDLEGRSVREAMTHGVRTWGNDPRGETVFLVGAYEHLSDISDRLLRSLPPVLSLSHRDWESPLVPLLCDEVVVDEPGQAAVLDRLLDLLITAVLKAWFARQDADRPAWWRHQGDRIVERALRLMHDYPARPWTLDALALETGASRASLARRFHNLVGEPPMTFLKHWRMALAADLLCQPDETVGSVAEKVGYATPYAFSTAFKRVRGVSPKTHRASALASD